MERALSGGPALDPYPEGEFLSIAEWVLVSPAWGRLRTGLEDGQRVDEGGVIGTVDAGTDEVPLVAPKGGTFLGWMAMEGELVWRGTPLARMRFGS